MIMVMGMFHERRRDNDRFREWDWEAVVGIWILEGETGSWTLRLPRVEFSYCMIRNTNNLLCPAHEKYDIW